MNASVIANKSVTTESEATFQAVVNEMQELSNCSMSNLASIESLLSQLREVSRTINKAGKQRMLAQKVMKLHLASDDNAMFREQCRATMSMFDRGLKELRVLDVNTDEINNRLDLVFEAWQEFKKAMTSKSLVEQMRANESVVRDMNTAVKLYEALLG